MKVLGLVGSPRKGGNTHLLVQEALAAAEEVGAKIELVHIADLDFQFCQSCFQCRELGACVLNDNLEDLLEKIEDADGLILGTPVYGHHLPGQLKALFDRLNSVSMLVCPKGNGITEIISRLPKKRRNGLSIAVCGAPIEEMANPSLTFLEGFLAIHGNGGILKRLPAPGLSAIGEVKNNEELLGKAREYGALVACLDENSY